MIIFRKGQAKTEYFAAKLDDWSQPVNKAFVKVQQPQTKYFWAKQREKNMVMIMHKSRPHENGCHFNKSLIQESYESDNLVSDLSVKSIIFNQNGLK